MTFKIPLCARTMWQKHSRARIFFFLGAVILMANIDALVHAALNPETPYFSSKHLLTGVVSAILFMVIFAVVMIKTAQARMQEDRLCTFFDTSPDAIVLVDLNGNILRVNKPALLMYDVSAGESDVIGRSIFDLIVPEERIGAAEEIARIIEEGIVRGISHTVLRKDGTKYSVELSAALVKNPSGRPESIMIIVRDLTEKQRTAEALRRAEEKYRTMIEYSNDLIWTLDRQGNFTYFNKRAEQLSHYTLSDLLGKSFTPLLNPSDLPRIAAIFESVVKGMPQQYELPVYRPDGSVFVLSVNAAPLYESGEIVGIVSFGRDITEQKRAEKAVQESEKRYKKLIESVTDYIYTVHVEDGLAIATKHGPGCVAVTGYTADEYDADPYLWFRMIHEDDRAAVMEQARSILAGTASHALEHRIIHRTGAVLWVKNTPVPRYDETGKLVAYDGLVIDITERKHLETQLRQAQKMEAVGQLAGGIAHDFNNILSAILGYASLLQIKLEPDNPLQPYVEQILASSHRAAHLTHSILAFSRKQIINPKPVDLHEILRRVEKLLVRLIGEDVELKTIECGTALPIMADAGQIEQVLINLCTNARDAMPDGGFLAIETRVEECDERFIATHAGIKPGTYAMISVSDTGTGMDEETREKIFEPFFTTKDVGKGTGLGLSIVYGIVKQHGGVITVYSESGKGTTFNIYLPIIKSETKEIEPAPVLPAAHGQETVLIAEDDVNVRKSAREIFGHFGYTVIEAEDGADAIEKFSEHQDAIKLVILDVLMPKKNGREAYEEIRKIKPEMKVIFTSGYTADILHTKGVLEKDIHFINKPLSTNEFIRMVRTVLDGDVRSEK